MAKNPGKMGEKFRIGDYWLDRRAGRDNWCACWYDKATKQVRRSSLGTTDFQAAQLAFAKWLVGKRALSHAYPDSTLLAELLVLYYNEHACDLPSWQTARKALDRWAEFYAESTAAELTLPRQKAFAAWLRDTQGLGPGGVRRTVAIGKAALNYAFESGRLATVPPISLKHLPRGAARDRVLDLDEAARLFNAVEHEHALWFLLLACNTWGRHRALLELTRFHVDLKRRLVRLNPPNRAQTKKLRPTVPITDTLLPWLAAAPRNHLVQWWGKPIKSVRGEFSRMCARAGLQNVTPHTIRHTLSTVLRNSYHVPPWEIAGFLGHRSKTYGTTEIYAQWVPSHTGPAALAIDAWFAELAPKIIWDLHDVAGTLERVREVESRKGAAHAMVAGTASGRARIRNQFGV